MSTLDNDRAERRVVVYPPDEALKRASPLVPRDDLVSDGISGEEWDAFQAALAET
jgi:hypothetical protein